MEPSSTKGWQIDMPIILDCLRKDIYSLVSKLDLPQEEQVKVGKIIEQIRLEETRYEQLIRTQIQEKQAAAEQEIAALKSECSELRKQTGCSESLEKGRDEQDKSISGRRA